MSDVTIQVLVENTTEISRLRGEHGLSVLVTTSDGSLLWDTGQSDLLLTNAAAMGLSLRDIDHCVLSHGHYDHTGGLIGVLRQAPGITLHAHPAVFEPRYTPAQEDSARSIGCPHPRDEIEHLAGEIILDSLPREILPGIHVTGEIARVSGEDTGGAFYRDENLSIPDLLPDDQTLIIETSSGRVVLMGCCHAGVMNTLMHCERLFGVSEYALITGGMHLLKASEERLKKTLNFLEERAVRMIAPGHCTGRRPVCLMMDKWNERCVPLATGRQWSFPR